jgi:two-component system CheB/CheR fusion protein
MYGYTEAEALKMNIQEIVPDEKKQETLNFIESIFRGEVAESFKTKRITKEGKIMDVWLTVTVLKDDRGNPEYVATTENAISAGSCGQNNLRMD